LPNGFYSVVTVNPGVVAFRWVMPEGGLSNVLLNVQHLNNDGIRGEQIKMVYTSKMLKALKANRANALIDVTAE